MKPNYPFRRGRSGDHNHWYSSTYWRSNRDKFNNCVPPGESPPHHSIGEKEIGSDHLNVIESNGYSFRPNVRSYTVTNLRLDSRQCLKRRNNCTEQLTPKRLRIADPFESPNSLIKDFRLTNTNGRNSADSLNDLFCQTCQTQCRSSLDYSNHLSGRRHKINMEAIDRQKHSNNFNQLHRLLKHSKEPIIGMNYIKEARQDVFTCELCKCYEMTPNNTAQHIRGFRHQRNFMAQKESEEKRKRSTEREKRQIKNQSISSGTQTNDNFNERERTHTTRSSASTATPSRPSRRDWTQNEIIPESDFQNLDSCKKTIENFRTIREICDQMIGYFSGIQKNANVSPKNRPSTGKTFECLVTKIKREH